MDATARMQVCLWSAVVLLAGGRQCDAALGDEFEIIRWTIDSGGIQSAAGGDFEMSGTAGQPDAGAPMAGGQFGLTGGSCAGPAAGEDCNRNGVRDGWDIAAGTSADCNTNATPDECDIAAGTSTDCNTNATPDECDIAVGTSSDCNTNAIPDECDIAGGTSEDCNANAIPDGCDIVDIGRPAPDDRFNIDGTVRTCSTDDDCLAGLSADSQVDCIQPPLGGEGVCYVRKNRYISIDPNMSTACAPTARRVALDRNDNDVYDAGIDAILGWVGEPIELAVVGPEPTPQLLARIVDESTRHYRDWSVDNTAQPWADATLHVGDCVISPNHTYVVQAIIEGHEIDDEANYSAPLTLKTTTLYGDVTGGVIGAPPDSARNFKDISATVRGFQSVQSEPKVWLDLQGPGSTPEIPDFSDINFADINWAVKGFQGGEYPFTAPCDCPDQACP